MTVVGGRTMAVAAAGIVAVIGGLYFWTAATSPAPARSFHSLLAEGFEDGRPSLPIRPLPELLALPDPYDPAQNAPYALHDASLYDGEYYLYFGPAPAALVFLPLRVVGVDLTDRWAAPVFALGALAFSALLLLFLIARYAPRTPPGWRLVAVAGLGLGNVLPFLLRRPAFYETSIAAGLFFLSAAALLLVSGALRERPSPRLIALGSLALGLAVASRASMILAVPLLVWAWWRALGPREERTPRSNGRWTLVAAMPLVICLVLLAFYNVIRFDSLLEQGTRYQLSTINPRTFDFFDLARIVPASWFYLLQPPEIGWDFPFFTLQPEYPGELPEGFFVEPVAGILTVTPLLAVLVAVPILRWRRPSARMRELALLIGLMIVIALAMPLLPAVTFGSATERYEVDFATLLLIPALVAWLVVAEGLRGVRGARRSALVIGTAAILFCSIVNLAFGVVGYYEGLRTAHLGIYQRLEGALAFIPTLGSKLEGKPLVLETGPPAGTPTTETVVQLAAPGAGTAVIRATPVASAALPSGSLVPADVRGPDGRVTRIRMTIGTPTNMTIRLGGAGLSAIQILWGTARIVGSGAPTDSAAVGVGLVDVRVIEWSPR